MDRYPILSSKALSWCGTLISARSLTSSNIWLRTDSQCLSGLAAAMRGDGPCRQTSLRDFRSTKFAVLYVPIDLCISFEAILDTSFYLHSLADVNAGSPHENAN